MKKILIFFLFVNFSFGQNLGKILKSDTLYVLYEDKKYIKKEERKINDTLTVTIFNLDFKPKVDVGNITLFDKKILSYKNKTAKFYEIEFIDKAFISKKKEIIINEKFLLKNNNLIKIKNLFNANSNIIFYVIDITKKTNKKFAKYPVKSMLREYKPSIDIVKQIPK